MLGGPEVTVLLSVQELAHMPIFPLPNLVLFPGALLPLHFFEPRYRALVRDCLATEGKHMVVAQVRPEINAAVPPQIYACAAVGRIIQHVENADGTYDVVLEGVARVGLDELPVEGPYRCARVHVLSERMPASGIDEGELAAVIALAESVRDTVRGTPMRFELAAKITDEPARLVDKLADQLMGDPRVRQDLLETLDVQQRLNTLARELVKLQAMLKSRLRKNATLN
jgi:Lon protease-like protein